MERTSKKAGVRTPPTVKVPSKSEKTALISVDGIGKTQEETAIAVADLAGRLDETNKVFVSLKGHLARNAAAQVDHRSVGARIAIQGEPHGYGGVGKQLPAPHTEALRDQGSQIELVSSHAELVAVFKPHAQGDLRLPHIVRIDFVLAIGEDPTRTGPPTASKAGIDGDPARSLAGITSLKTEAAPVGGHTGRLDADELIALPQRVGGIARTREGEGGDGRKTQDKKNG